MGMADRMQFVLQCFPHAVRFGVQPGRQLRDAGLICSARCRLQVFAQAHHALGTDVGTQPARVAIGGL